MPPTHWHFWQTLPADARSNLPYSDMRICHIISRIDATADGTLVGGPPNTMRCLAKKQSAMGHDVSILAGCPGREAISNARRAFSPMHLRPIPITRSFAGPLRGIQFLAKGLSHGILCRKAIKAHQVLHSHSGYSQLALLASAIGKLCDVPTVHTLYCPVIGEVEEHRNWFLTTKTARISLKGIDRIVAISENIRRSLISCGIEQNRIRVIPPGIDTSRFHPDVDPRRWRERLRIPEGGRLVVYLGNLVKAKGLDVMIESLKCVAREVSPLFFAYALQNQHRRFEIRRQQYRDALEQIPLAGPALELGPVPRIEELLAAADVFVSPLRTTNGLADYPISVMEAMAVGRPVVSTAVGGVKEVISHETNGLLAAPGDPEDLARQIVRVLTSPSLAAELGFNARRRIEEHYSMDRCASDVMNLYDEVLATHQVPVQSRTVRDGL